MSSETRDRDAQRTEADALNRQTPEPRATCEARRLVADHSGPKPCLLAARSVVRYRGESRNLCTAHAKTYAQWGDRDREQMAHALWDWPTQRELDAGRQAHDTPSLMDDLGPLPRRTADGHGHVTSATQPYLGSDGRSARR